MPISNVEFRFEAARGLNGAFNPMDGVCDVTGCKNRTADKVLVPFFGAGEKRVCSSCLQKMLQGLNQYILAAKVHRAEVFMADEYGYPPRRRGC